MYHNVVWATDGSDGADAALAEALRVLDPAGRLLAVHCDQRVVGGRANGISAYVDEPEIRQRLGRKVEKLQEQGVDAELVVKPTHQPPAQIVAEIAREMDADVIVCGTRGLAAVSGLFLGSFTQRLLHVAPCPVLAVGLHAHAERERTEKLTAATV